MILKLWKRVILQHRRSGKRGGARYATANMAGIVKASAGKPNSSHRKLEVLLN